MPLTNSCDVLIIGGGPGGYQGAIRAAQAGLRTALVEKNKLGGTCLQEGCIPTKSLIHVAGVLNTVKYGEESGIKVEQYSLDWDKIQQNKNQVVDRLTKGLGQLISANKVDLVEGEARLIEDKKVVVKTHGGENITLRGENIIIATGSHAVKPPIPGVDLPGVIDSREALELPTIPKSMLIIGGGIIGMEFASLYNALGCDVTVVELLPRILSGMDREISRRMESEQKRRGIKILTGGKVLGLNEGCKGLEACIEHRGKEKTIPVEKILLAVGRSPNIENIELETLGIKLTENNGISVSEYMGTNAAGVYAIGDVTGDHLLAHVASAEASVAVDNIIGGKRKMSYRAVPSVVYTFPETASVGITEEQAKEEGMEYKCTKFMMSANSKAAVTGSPQGIVKIITNPEDNILG
ncbi:MAG: dihydrolipoyl dehydrogenase, partial [Clostridia bacterium]|nr:dihydrolipoyl dehydrogenase [Clostridia bacterium]